MKFLLPGDSAAVLHVNSAGEFGKKNRYGFQTFTIVNCALGSKFWGKINFRAGPGAPQKQFLAKGALETSSFQFLLQNIFSEMLNFFGIGPAGAPWGAWGP